MSKDKLDLKRAYSLKTPQDSVALYRDWAESYDIGFADRMDYRAPSVVAELFAENAKDPDNP
ncbi:MAG: putative TPR repeat methyltransferase, partial [Paracoccaceae bacterium]